MTKSCVGSFATGSAKGDSSLNPQRNIGDKCIAWKTKRGVGLELYGLDDPLQILKDISAKQEIRWFSICGDDLNESLVEFVLQMGTLESLHIVESTPSAQMFHMLLQSSIVEVTSSNSEIVEWMRSEAMKVGSTVNVQRSL